MIHHGDCLAVLPTLDADSFDACVTDPPYGIRFMGKAWDGADIAARVAHARATQVPPVASRPKGGTSGFGGGGCAAGEAGHYDLGPRGMRVYQEWTETWAREGFRWVGIEREAEYVAIAEQRIGLLG